MLLVWLSYACRRKRLKILLGRQLCQFPLRRFLVQKWWVFSAVLPFFWRSTWQKKPWPVQSHKEAFCEEASKIDLHGPVLHPNVVRNAKKNYRESTKTSEILRFVHILVVAFLYMDDLPKRDNFYLIADQKISVVPKTVAKLLKPLSKCTRHQAMYKERITCDVPW